MEQSRTNETLIKSALFVDFDNIYIGLSKTDPQAAERFASDPARWLSWLENGMPVEGAEGTVMQRRRQILIRRCYPNPDAGFRRYRSFFTSAAFSVIDCPSMTRAGKNSADIYMVMDILDTLNHRTSFDEFIVFSGDSDFMPVLLRLRAHDRRTTTLAIDFMPPAYRAACDLVISEEDFIEEALGISHEGNCGGNGLGRGRVSAAVLKEMTTRVFEAVCIEGEVAGADLPDILKDFRAFRESNNWLGFGTSQRLAEALICSEPRLDVIRLSPTMYKISLKQPAALPDLVTVEPPAKTTEKNGQPERPAARPGRVAEKASRAEMQRLRARVIEVVKELAASSTSPILLARASQFVVSKIGPQVLDSQWAGTGSFKRLLQSADNLGLEITTQPEPGYLFDPGRHPHPQSGRVGDVSGPGNGSSHAPEDEELIGENLPRVEEPVEKDFALETHPEDYQDDEDDEQEISYNEPLPSLEEFTRRVSQVTGAPHLTPYQYALVFQGIIVELQQIAEGQKTYSTYQSSKAVSDWCADHGESIARSDIVLIFKGIIFQDGVRFGKQPGSYTALDLASVVRENIQALCRRSRMELSEYEERLLEEWILGDLENEMLPSDAPQAAASAADDEGNGETAGE